MRATCEVHNGDLRVEQARAATAGCGTGDHLAAIVGGIANFHKLPYTLSEVNAALYNAVFRAALDHDVERLLYVSSSMVFERATEFPTTEAHIDACPTPRSAYGFSKLTGKIFTLAAHEEFGLPYTICRPFNAYGPGEMPDDEPGIAHLVPDLIKKVLGGQRPLQIFGFRPSRRGRHIRGRHRRPNRDRPAQRGGPQRGLQHLGLRGADRRRDRPGDLGGVRGRVRGASALEHLPTYLVDVQRRWPSVQKARTLLGSGGSSGPPRRCQPDRGLAARAADVATSDGAAGLGHHSRAQPARWLPAAIDSALVQKPPGGPVEILVIDDGSTDDTPQVLEVYADRVRIIRQRNRGLVGAVDRGLAEAAGEYIALLDADDEWPPTGARAGTRRSSMHTRRSASCTATWRSSTPTGTSPSIFFQPCPHRAE